TAAKAGDSNYNSVTSNTVTITLQSANQSTLTLTSTGPLTFGGTDGTSSTTGGSGTGAVSYSAGGSTGCTVDTATGAVHVTNASGTCAITATKAGDSNYTSVTSNTLPITLQNANQSGLTFTSTSPL